MSDASEPAITAETRLGSAEDVLIDDNNVDTANPPSWLRARRRARREHFEEIKAGVLRPLAEELEHFYLPLLRGEFGPVVLEPGPRLGRRRTPPVLFKPEHPGEVNTELYEDAKRRHYASLISRREDLKADAEAYGSRWVAYAEGLSQILVDRVGRPVTSLDPTSTDDAWVTTRLMTLIVLNRQLEVISRPSWCGARLTSEEPMQQIPHVWDELSEHPPLVARARELQRAGRPLVERAALLLSELNALLRSAELPGRCRRAAGSGAGSGGPARGFLWARNTT